jgi:hypothetical protein
MLSLTYEKKYRGANARQQPHRELGCALNSWGKYKNVGVTIQKEQRVGLVRRV